MVLGLLSHDILRSASREITSSAREVVFIVPKRFTDIFKRNRGKSSQIQILGHNN